MIRLKFTRASPRAGSVKPSCRESDHTSVTCWRLSDRTMSGSQSAPRAVFINAEVQRAVGHEHKRLPQMRCDKSRARTREHGQIE
jgi:hypothetical protein